MDLRSAFPKGFGRETMAVEMVMVNKSRLLQERLRRWDDSVVTSRKFNFCMYTQKETYHNIGLCNSVFSSTSRTHHRSLYRYFACNGCDCDVSELGTSTCVGPVISRRSSGVFGRGTFRATAARVLPSTGPNDDSGTAIVRCPGVGGAMLELGLSLSFTGDCSQVLSGVPDRTLSDLLTGLFSEPECDGCSSSEFSCGGSRK